MRANTLQPTPATHSDTNRRHLQWAPSPSDTMPSGLTRKKEGTRFREVTSAAMQRWLKEPGAQHLPLLNKLRSKMLVPNMQPSHFEYVDACIRCLEDALKYPSPHLDLSLLHASLPLSDEDLAEFAQQRVQLEPAVRSVTLPAQATLLPSYLARLETLERVYAPEYRGDLFIPTDQWKTVQFGYYNELNRPPIERDFVRNDPPDIQAYDVRIVLRPAQDALAHQSFSHAAAEFARQFPAGTHDHALAVHLASRLVQTLHWYETSLDVSDCAPDMLERAGHFGLFGKFSEAHRSAGAYMVVHPRSGETKGYVSAVTSLDVKLPPGQLQQPEWASQLEGLRRLETAD